MNKHKILIIEQDLKLVSKLIDGLGEGLYDIHIIVDSPDLSYSSGWQQHDVIIIGSKGAIKNIGLYKDIYKNSGAHKVIGLFDEDMNENIIQQLQIYVDDYIIKPFGIKELTIRIQSLLSKVKVSNKYDRFINFGEFKIDQDAKCLLAADRQKIHLTRKEYNLLVYFIENQEQVLSREDILDSVWGGVRVGARSVDNFVYSINKKLSKYSISKKPPKINNKWGVGYQMNLCGDNISILKNRMNSIKSLYDGHAKLFA